MPYLLKFKNFGQGKLTQINRETQDAEWSWSPSWMMNQTTLIYDEVLSNPVKFKNLSGFSNRMHPGCLQSLWWNPGLKSDSESHLDQGTAPIWIWRRWVFHQFQHQRFLFLQAPVQYHWSSFPSILPRHAPRHVGSLTWNSRWRVLSRFYLFHWLDCRL